MLMHILSGTPKWVFVLFVVLLWLGLQQMQPRSVSLTRATLLPLGMTALSLSGVFSAFGDTPLALLAWAAGAALAFTTTVQLQSSAGIRLDTASGRFFLPGSAVPLALFMGIFLTKYAVGISMGMHPSLAQNTSFAMGLSTLYGAFSGIFLARVARLWHMTLQQDKSMQAA